MDPADRPAPPPAAPSAAPPVPGAALQDQPYLWIPIAVAVGLLVFLAGPLGSEIREPIYTAERLVIYAGVAAFVAVYLWAIPADLAGRGVGRPLPAAVLLVLLAVGIALLDRGSDWTVLFMAAATAAGRITPSRGALAATAVIAGLGALVLLVPERAPARAIGSAFEVALTGLVVLGFSQLERTARQLARAQAEVARLAADGERARIARDLHDLLGQSLSVIALKTELARRMIERDPPRASAELGDVEAVVRSSLRDVREAVAGYRRLSLDTELAGARMALSAAGIAVEVRHPADPLDQATDTLLGWVVREGTTNVVRHSGSAHCAITVEATAHEARLEILDDGRGAEPRGPARGSATGSGLAGIRERVEAAGGTLDAGPPPEGGYRLVVVVPVPAEPAAASAPAAAATGPAIDPPGATSRRAAP
ncbi:MAG: sensor histidine kinase [Chloroflexi bacterium]|nr:sensor histidine kinase [Chloroflexota bacterium]